MNRLSDAIGLRINFETSSKTLNITETESGETATAVLGGGGVQAFPISQLTVTNNTSSTLTYTALGLKVQMYDEISVNSTNIPGISVGATAVWNVPYLWNSSLEIYFVASFTDARYQAATISDMVNCHAFTSGTTHFIVPDDPTLPCSLSIAQAQS